MKGTGWLVPRLLFLGLASAGEVWFCIVVGALVFWIVRQNRKTGRADGPMKIIEDLFIDKDRKDC